MRSDSLRSCFDFAQTQKVFQRDAIKAARCFMVFSPTREVGSAVTQSAARLQRLLSKHEHIPRLNHVQLLHVKVKPAKVAKWKSASTSLYSHTAMAALQGLSSKPSKDSEGQLANVVHAKLALFCETHDSDIHDKVKEAAEESLTAYRTELLPAFREKPRNARDHAQRARARHADT